jgi:solute carrier family 8 (sodium/calcium exchanger)
VNVFLGLGLPWVISSIYHVMHDKEMKVPSVGLDVSVAVFVIVSLVGISILLIRRFVFKGELGGSIFYRWLSCIIFISLWFIYVFVSALALYGKIKLTKSTPN